MRLASKEILRRLGAGESIAAVCEAAGISREAFDAWWRDDRAEVAKTIRHVLRLEPDGA